MSPIYPGRYTAGCSDPIVVFPIGMRINRLWAVRKWLPVVRAMSQMLQTLHAHPEKGFLGAESFLNWPGVTLVQYWRSYEDLEFFARNPSDPHLAAWQAFHRAIGGDGSVGIWHETYAIAPGQYEAVYVNMPAFGLAKATQHIPVTGKHHTSRQRMQGNPTHYPVG